jgi:rSAM/selenodomain-associated transferase 1
MQRTGSQRCLIVVCKEPRAGSVKTRLAASIGDATAARLYEAFLLDTLDLARSADGCRLALSFPRGAGAGYFARIAPDALHLPQTEGDFGARLAGAFDRAWRAGHRDVVLIGSDAPQVGAACLSAAFGHLQAGRPAIGPSLDGGFYLLALREPAPRLFEGIEWSTPRVYAQVLERAREARLELAELEPAFDIDEEGDLERLRDWIGRHGNGHLRRSADMLARIDAR